MAQELALTESDQVLLALLRTKGLSIKNLDDQTKKSLRDFLELLCNSRGMSLNDVANLIGNKTSGYTSWLCRQLGVKVRPFEEARLKGIKEKRRKYERKPFDGTDEDRAYLLGLRHGDLSVSKPWKGVVRVSTSTTHPAMADLFRKLFEPHGHVYQDPRFKKDTNSYEWNLYTILDSSFEFLISPFSDLVDWIASRPSMTRAYLAGLFDAEGSVGIYPAKLLTSLNVIYYNTNLELMWFVHKAITSLGFHPLEPYLDKKKGFRSPGYHIEMKKDYWRVMIARFEECQRFLESVPLRHLEKVQKKNLAASLVLGLSWKETGPRVQAIRSAIKSDRDMFVALAQKKYLDNPRHHQDFALKAD
ncbi:MAG TPA: LAGLIDADG family homing endonuclease [Nitrososphaerales archaeon]|nr:LAGLIDADG family homing endonuclease [Nitrososphaerales archaeon]